MVPLIENKRPPPPDSPCRSVSYSLIYMTLLKAPCAVDGQAPQ